MAKIKWGALVTDGRGKLGGHVLSKNRAGAYIRTKVTPDNRQTTYQTRVRNIFALITTAWSALTSAQISAWNGAVSDWQRTDIFGDLKKPTGKNLYQRLNQNALNAGYPQMTTPPDKVVLPDTIITGATFTVAGNTLVFAGMSTDPGFKALVSATPAVTRGTSFVKNIIRNIGFDDLDTYGAAAMGQNYIDKFGAPQVGDKIFAGLQYVAATGQISPMQIVEVTIV